MPEGMDLPATYSIRWAALDPVTGLDVSGVKIDTASLLVTQVTPGGPAALTTDDFVALFTPLPLDDQTEPDSGDE